jgi:septum formation protein
MTPKLVLASASPRRQALLRALGVSFDVITSNAREIDEGAVPEKIVIGNAERKRDAAAGKINGDAVIIAADTLVFFEDHVLSKPADHAEAAAMLQRLSGKTHQVVTGIAIANTRTGRRITGSETTDVTFRRLNDRQIERFIDIVNPVDRAGAYTVDGPGSLLVARYDGCYQNVLGLPMVRLDLLLREAGFDLTEAMDAGHARYL